MRLPSTLYTAAQVRELDRRAIEVHGIAGAELMTRAGTAVFEAVRERFPGVRRLILVCGPGNNGGDGYVIARLAREAGWESTVLALGKVPVAGDAGQMRASAEAAGVAVQPFVAGRLRGAELVVDALLGTGLQRPVEGEWRAAIEAMNVGPAPVVAVDVPSGLNADTGAVMGAAVRARLTVCFIGLKVGLYTADGPDHAGEIVFSNLNVPSTCYENLEPAARLLQAEELRSLVTPRRRNAHKGTFGHLLVIGGGPGMPGAARLCGEAALRVGTGLVTLATHPDHAPVINAARPELLVQGIREVGDLGPLLERASAVALGPGLGTSAWARTVWGAALDAGRPLVVDADGLNLLAESPGRRDDWVLTPHPGEAGRLLKRTTAEVQRDRPDAAAGLARTYGGVIVLKGAGSLIVAADGTWLCDRGNPGMASGGTGDVLTGVIAGLRAQGFRALDAARLGTWLHAVAGDEAAAEGEAGLIASDLFAPLRRRLNRLAHDDVTP